MKFHTTVLAACATAFLQVASAAAPTPIDSLLQPARGVIAQPTAEQIPALCEASITDAKVRIEKLKVLPLAKAYAKTVLGAWNDLDIVLQNIGGPIGLLMETSPDPEVRKAAEACDLLLSALPNDYLQSDALFKRVDAVRTSNAIDAVARQSILDDFKERGVNLSGPARERAKQIFERLDKLAQDFQRNTRDVNTKLAFAESDLKGIPANMLTNRAKDAQGKYLFGLDYPEQNAVMNFVESEPTRQAFYLAFNQRGGQVNLDLLKEATVLRLELAKLMGETNFADWSIKRKMAGDAAAVNKFLDDVQGRVTALERKELD